MFELAQPLHKQILTFIMYLIVTLLFFSNLVHRYHHSIFILVGPGLAQESGLELRVWP